MLGSREHYELMKAFEARYIHPKIKPQYEAKELWKKGYIYIPASLNQQFKDFTEGYAYGKLYERMNGEG